MHKNKQVIEKYQECIAHYRAFVDRGGGALWHENFRNRVLCASNSVALRAPFVTRAQDAADQERGGDTFCF